MAAPNLRQMRRKVTSVTPAIGASTARPTIVKFPIFMSKNIQVTSLRGNVLRLVIVMMFWAGRFTERIG